MFVYAPMAYPNYEFFSNRDVRKRDHSFNNDEKLGQLFTFTKKKGDYCIPGSAEKGGFSARTSVLCNI